MISGGRVLAQIFCGRQVKNLVSNGFGILRSTKLRSRFGFLAKLKRQTVREQSSFSTKQTSSGVYFCSKKKRNETVTVFHL